MGWRSDRPRFKQRILDKDHGGAVNSLLKAVEIVSANRDKYRSTYQQETNSIKGLVLTQHKNGSGKTHYWRWQVGYYQNWVQKNKVFSFWKTGKVYELYLKSVKFVLDIGIKIDLDQIDEYFLQYIQKIDNQGFFERSDIKMFNSESGRTILKIRHLQWKEKIRMVRPYS